MGEYLKAPRLLVFLSTLVIVLCPFQTARADNYRTTVDPEITHQVTSVYKSVNARSWYGSTMVLLSQAQTEPKTYDGSSIGIEMTCSSVVSGTFVVSLYRVGSTSAQFVGSADFNRQGFTKATWNGVGAGRYYFTFTKPNDGNLVISYDVATYSW